MMPPRVSLWQFKRLKESSSFGKIFPVTTRQLLLWTVTEVFLLLPPVIFLALRVKLHRYVCDANPFQNRFEHSEVSQGSCEIFGIVVGKINGKDDTSSRKGWKFFIKSPRECRFPNGPHSLIEWNTQYHSGLTDKNCAGELWKGFWIQDTLSVPVVSSARDLHYEPHDWNVVLWLWQQLQAWNKMSSPFLQDLSSEFLFRITVKHVKTARVTRVAHFFCFLL